MEFENSVTVDRTETIVPKEKRTEVDYSIYEKQIELLKLRSYN